MAHAEAPERVTERCVEITRKCLCRSRIGPNHQVAASGQLRDPGTGHSAQAPGHPMPDHSRPDRLGDHETHPGRSAGRAGPVGAVHHDQRRRRAEAPTATADHRAEVARVGQPMASREHCALTWTTDGVGSLRRRACRGPCDGGPPGWRDRRACSSGGGTRACGHAGGCWAGRCACSLLTPLPRPGQQHAVLVARGLARSEVVLAPIPRPQSKAHVRAPQRVPGHGQAKTADTTARSTVREPPQVGQTQPGRVAW